MTDLFQNKPDTVPAAEQKEFLAQQRGLERGYSQELLKSRAMAWRIAGVSAVIAVLAVGSVVVLTPLKEPPVMYAVRVDNATGNIEHVSRLGEPLETYGERIDRFFLHRYVLNCEGYDWYQIQEMYNTCGLFSAPDVQRDYRKKFAGDKGLDKTLGSQYRIAVDAQPPVIGANNTATIRFTTLKEAVGQGSQNKPEHWIASVSYHYINADITPKNALANPLGFQVLSYRVDPEIR